MDTNTFIIPNKRATHKTAFTSTMKREEQRKDKMVHFQHHEPTATPREGHKAWGPKRFSYQNHPLHLMVLVLIIHKFHRPCRCFDLFPSLHILPTVMTNNYVLFVITITNFLLGHVYAVPCGGYRSHFHCTINAFSAGTA